MTTPEEHTRRRAPIDTTKLREVQRTRAQLLEASRDEAE